MTICLKVRYCFVGGKNSLFAALKWLFLFWAPSWCINRHVFKLFSSTDLRSCSSVGLLGRRDQLCEPSISAHQLFSCCNQITDKWGIASLWILKQENLPKLSAAVFWWSYFLHFVSFYRLCYGVHLPLLDFGSPLNSDNLRFTLLS